MNATVFEIVGKVRQSMYDFTHLSDFALADVGEIGTGALLANRHVTLYSLDFDTETAVFVETAAEVDLSQAPFMFVVQYEQAIRVFTVPFETFCKWGMRYRSMIQNWFLSIRSAVVALL